MDCVIILLNSFFFLLIQRKLIFIRYLVGFFQEQECINTWLQDQQIFSKLIVTADYAKYRI